MSECFICLQPISYPTLLHCKQHVGCLGCIWQWACQSYSDHVPDNLDVHTAYTVEELTTPPTISTFKCPACSQKGRIDESLAKLTVLPVSLQAMFEGNENWSCPFCQMIHCTTRHVLTCSERSFKCPALRCSETVRVMDKQKHMHQCKRFVCPVTTCDQKDVVVTASELIHHQNTTHAVPYCNDSEDDVVNYDSDESYDEECADSEEEEESIYSDDDSVTST